MGASSWRARAFTRRCRLAIAEFFADALGFGASAQFFLPDSADFRASASRDASWSLLLTTRFAESSITRTQTVLLFKWPLVQYANPGPGPEERRQSGFPAKSTQLPVVREKAWASNRAAMGICFVSKFIGISSSASESVRGISVFADRIETVLKK